MTRPPFPDWAAGQLGLSAGDVDDLKLVAVFDMFVSRLEAARVRGAVDPLETVTAKRAGGNSRACTRRMLGQLDFTDPQRRAIHRLLAGSPSGWPGLLRLYVLGNDLNPGQRQYARRQVASVVAPAHESVPRRGSRAACSARPLTP